MSRALAAVTALMLVLPQAALAATPEEEEKFDPSREFELHAWIPIHIGPLDLSINKAVAYLLLGTAVAILLGIVLMRVRLGIEPDRRQTAGEWIYDIAQTNIAEQGLPSRAIGRWFPYCASLLIFIWTLNMLSFIPLPISDERTKVAGVELPTLGLYAATSSIAVTLTLALMTFVFTHIEGIRENGFRGYFASWMPSGMPTFTFKWAIPLGLLYLLEILGQFMRLVSLSVRLFANMLAGHVLILTFISLIFLMSGWVFALTPVIIMLTTLFYLFEVIIVVSIQAFIFAALSAIYIGSAIEPEH
jgi:F-type H+-transporting ATPase subunit a